MPCRGGGPGERTVYVTDPATCGGGTPGWAAGCRAVRPAGPGLRPPPQCGGPGACDTRTAPRNASGPRAPLPPVPGLCPPPACARPWPVLVPGPCPPQPVPAGSCSCPPLRVRVRHCGSARSRPVPAPGQCPPARARARHCGSVPATAGPPAPRPVPAAACPCPPPRVRGPAPGGPCLPPGAGRPLPDRRAGPGRACGAGIPGNTTGGRRVLYTGVDPRADGSSRMLCRTFTMGSPGRRPATHHTRGPPAGGPPH